MWAFVYIWLCWQHYGYPACSAGSKMDELFVEVLGPLGGYYKVFSFLCDILHLLINYNFTIYISEFYSLPLYIAISLLSSPIQLFKLLINLGWFHHFCLWTYFLIRPATFHYMQISFKILRNYFNCCCNFILILTEVG